MNIFNYRFRAIVKRELKQQIFSKKFIIITVVFPLVLMAMFGVQVLVMTFDRQEHSVLHIVNESSEFQANIVDQVAASDLENAELYELHYELVSDDAVDTYIEENRDALLRGQITGVLFIPDSAREDKQARYYSANPGNQTLQSRMRDVIAGAVLGEYLRDRNIDSSVIAYTRSSASLEGIRVSEEGNAEAGAGTANLILATIFTFFMYTSLSIMGPTVMGAISEEKTSRVVEILLSSVTSNELMAGKIVGTAIAGLLQMLIWLSPMLALGALSLPALEIAGGLDFDVSGLKVAYFLLNYLFGVLIFMSIFAAFGAMFDNPQDAQSSMMPVMMLIIIPLFLALSMLRNPANVLAEVSSMLPFTNLLVMPARMTLIDVPVWQLLLATGVNALTFYCCIIVGAKVYRTTILLSGKKLSWKEVIKWIRYE